MAKIYGSSEIWGDLLVTGSFSVLGSASTINTTNLVVSDTIISLGHSQSGSPVLDEGIMFGRGTGLTQAFIWDETNDTFALIGTNDDHTVLGSVNVDSYSNLRVGGLTTSDIKITNGAASGYVLTSDASGNATWTSAASSSANFANTDLTLTGNRIHNTNGNDLIISSDGIGNDFVIGFQGTQSLSVGHINYYQEFTSSDLSIQELGGTRRLEINSTETIFGPFNANRDFRIVGLSDSSAFFLDSLNNNVGIGTDTPTEKLEVNGRIKTTNFQMTTSPTTGYVLTSDASGNATWQAASGGGTTPSLSQVLAVGNSSGVNNIILPDPAYIGFTSSSYTMRLFTSTLTANWSIVMPNNGGTMALVSDIPTSVVTGTGTTNYLPKWSSSTDLSNSLIYDNGTNVFIGTTLSSSDTQLYIRKNNTTIRTGIHSEISSGTYSIAISGNIGTSLGFGSGDVGVLGNIGTSTASTTYAIYARNAGTNTDSYGVYASLTLSTTTYGMYTTIQSGTAGSYYGNYVTIGTGVSNNTFGTNNWGSYISNLGNASTNTGLYTQVNNGSFANNAVWAVVGNSPTYSSGDKAVFAWVATTATNTTNSSYAGYFNNSSKTTSSSYGLASVVSSTESSANYGLFVQTSGSSINYGVVVNTGTSIFNEAGDANTDFRIEGDTNANLFFVDASTDSIGIGTNTPVATLDVRGSAIFNNSNGSNDFTIEGTLDASLFTTSASGDNVGIAGYSSNTKFSISTTRTTHTIGLAVNNNNGTASGINYGAYITTATTNTSTNYGLYVDTTLATTNYGIVVNKGTSVFNGAGDASTDFRIGGDSVSSLFYVDASTDNIGIGTSTPVYKLHVTSGTVSTSNLRSNYIVSTTAGNTLNLEYSNGEKNIEFTTNSNGSEIKFNNSGTITAGTSSITQYPTYFEMLTSTRSYFNLRDDGAGLLTFGDISENDQIRFYMTGGSGTVPTVGGSGIYTAYNLRVNGTLSKAAGTFQIDHPLPELKETHTLLHSFVEAPQANNIYRGKSQLVNGFIEINLDEQFNMTEGTLLALNKNFQCFTSNETGWDAVKGTVVGNKLQINCINSNSSDEISWLVIGERHDDYILSSGLYDINGEFIVEKPKV